MSKGFLIIKIIRNRHEDVVEPICVCENGTDLDKKILEIGECNLNVYHDDYWETRDINLDTLEIF